MFQSARSLRIAVSAALLSACIAACSEGPKQDHMANAQQYLAEQNYRAAVIELKNVLQENTDNAQARWLLATIYLDFGDLTAAEQELRRAQELGWTGDDVVPTLARVLSQQGRHEDVLALDVSGLAPVPAGRLWAWQALSALAAGNPQHAGVFMASAEQAAGDDVSVRLAGAQLQASQGNLSEGLEDVQGILDVQPDYGPAWRLKGDIALQRGELDTAREAYNRAVDLNIDNAADRFKLALIHLQMGNLEEAEKQAQAILEARPKNLGANYIVGIVRFSEQRYVEAIAALSIAEPLSKQFPVIPYYLGSAHLQERSMEQAAVAARRFHNASPDNAAGRKLLALILLQTDREGEARQLLEPVLYWNPDDVQALNMTAASMIREGEPEQAVALLSRVAELQPDSAEAQIRLGTSLLGLGQDEAGASHILSALELDPGLEEALVILVINHIQNARYDEAIEAAESYQSRNPSAPVASNLLARTYLAAGREEEARTTFEKTLSLSPGDLVANQSLAQMAERRGDPDSARKRYENVLQYDKNSLPALMELARLAEDANRPEAMLGYLERALESHPKALDPRVSMARYYLYQNRPSEAESVLQDLDETQRELPQVLELQARVQLATKKYDAASQTLMQLGQTAPPSTYRLYLMAIAAEGEGDRSRAKTYLERVIALDENHFQSHILLAKISLADDSEADFKRHLAKLEELAPGATEVLLLQAGAARRRGDQAAALAYLERAYEANPSTRTVTALTAYGATTGDTDKALSAVREWLERNPEDVQARMALAELLYTSDRRGEALAQWEAVLDLNPQNTTALNNLAWALREEEPGKALQYAARASELSPESPNALDTLAVVQYHNQQYHQASRTINRALAASPDTPAFLYHSAMIDIALNNKAAARETLEKLIAMGGSNPDFPEHAQAVQLLEQTE